MRINCVSLLISKFFSNFSTLSFYKKVIVPLPFGYEVELAVGWAGCAGQT